MVLLLPTSLSQQLLLPTLAVVASLAQLPSSCSCDDCCWPRLLNSCGFRSAQQLSQLSLFPLPDEVEGDDDVTALVVVLLLRSCLLSAEVDDDAVEMYRNLRIVAVSQTVLGRDH